PVGAPARGTPLRRRPAQPSPGRSLGGPPGRVRFSSGSSALASCYPAAAETAGPWPRHRRRPGTAGEAARAANAHRGNAAEALLGETRLSVPLNDQGVITFPVKPGARLEREDCDRRARLRADSAADEPLGDELIGKPRHWGRKVHLEIDEVKAR